MSRTDLLEAFHKRGAGRLPGYMGIQFTEAAGTEMCAEIKLKDVHLAPNGYLHAGTVVTLADTCCGYGCFANLPEGASGFTTVELKSNHLGTALEGTIVSRAKAVHLGRTTQVWDAVVSHKETGKTIALFRCTQMILYPK
jgi:1,4-dihydroxy-2-naphthoyl-CoA hydrolase